MGAIEIDDITKIFKVKKKGSIHAVRNLSLVVEQGEVFGFLGPNGSGKSSTIKITMGLIKQNSGHVRINGHDSTSPASRLQVGYLPENPAFYDYLTAREYLLFVGKTFMMTAGEAAEKAEEVLKLLELWDARNRPIRSYSKGMVQRLGLAQVLIHDPAVYILDEPMSGLDPIGRALVKEIILGLKRRGKTVFFSSHITSDVETVCDRVGIILQGTLQRVEKVTSIMTSGIVGYTLHIFDKITSKIDEIHVQNEQLTDFMLQVRDTGREVRFIEPRRKNLEDFFLDIVKHQS